MAITKFFVLHGKAKSNAVASSFISQKALINIPIKFTIQIKPETKETQNEFRLIKIYH